MKITNSLYESISAILLREFDENITWNKLGNKILANYEEMTSKFLGNLSDMEKELLKKEILNKVKAADPTTNQQYSLWLLTRLANKDNGLRGLYVARKAEDAVITGYKSYLEKFDILKKNRKLSGADADINRYKSFKELFEKIATFKKEDFESGKSKRKDIAKEMQKQAEVFLDNPKYTVIVPLTQEASCYYGQNTKWCTASTQSDNVYNSYTKDGQKLFIIVPKAPTHTGEKYQVHFQTGSFMDEHDDEVEIGDLITMFPEFFKKASNSGELSEFVMFMPTESKEKMISSLAFHMDEFVRSIGEEAREDDQGYSRFLAKHFAEEDGDVDWDNAYEDYPYSDFNPDFKLWLDNVEGYKFRSVVELDEYLLQFNEFENPAVLLYVGKFFEWVINEKAVENNDETWFTDEIIKRVKSFSVRREDGYLY